MPKRAATSDGRERDAGERETTRDRDEAAAGRDATGADARGARAPDEANMTEEGGGGCPPYLRSRDDAKTLISSETASRIDSCESAAAVAC